MAQMQSYEAKVGQRVFICPAAYLKFSETKLPLEYSGVGVIIEVCDFHPTYCCYILFDNGLDYHIRLRSLVLN